MSGIDLLLDEENELTFALTIEGTRPATAQCRLILESDDMSLAFESDSYDGNEVSVTLPPLKHVLKEGEYNMDLEVIIEDKYFKPLSLIGNFEKSLTITAAPITKSKRKQNTTPQVTLSEVKVKNRKSLEKPAIRNNENKVDENIKKEKITDKQILAIIDALSSGKIK